MKFNDTHDSDATEFSEEPTSDRDVQMPLGTSVLNEETALDPLAGASGGKKLSGGTIIIAVVVVIAAGGLFAMRQVLKMTAVTFGDGETESVVDSFIAKISHGSSPGANPVEGEEIESDAAVIEVLSESYTEHQIPLRDVQKNPFILLAVGGEEKTDATVNPAHAIGVFEQRKAERRAEFEAFAAQLRLKSIMGGSSPLAIIEDRIVREGEEIAIDPEGIRMTVEKINTKDVVLLGRAPEFDLVVRVTLEVSTSPGPRSPAPKPRGRGKR